MTTYSNWSHMPIFFLVGIVNHCQCTNLRWNSFSAWNLHNDITHTVQSSILLHRSLQSSCLFTHNIGYLIPSRDWTNMDFKAVGNAFASKLRSSYFNNKSRLADKTNSFWIWGTEFWGWPTTKSLKSDCAKLKTRLCLIVNAISSNVPGIKNWWPDSH